MRRRIGAFLIGGWLLLGCGGGGDGGAEGDECGPSGACPSGLICNELDNRCYRSESMPKSEWTQLPPAATNQPSATFGFSARPASATFECRMDGAAFAACAPPTTLIVAEGAHTFEVRATDPTRNLRENPPLGHAFTVDLTPPSTDVAGGPGEVTRATDATFTYTSDEDGATFECSLDGAAFVACPASFTGLAEGPHTLHVRAVDAAGNVDPVGDSVDWSVDLTGPSPTITGGPDEESTSGRDVTFTFSAEPGGVYECRLDAGAAADCSGGQVTFTGLPGGHHTLSVVGTDVAGNPGTPVTRGWTVNAVGPTVTLTGGPAPSSTSGPAVAFQFTASVAGSTFQCALDEATFASCASGQTYADLSEGPHTFHVRATDPQSNTGGETSLGWSVDRTPPAVTLTYPASGSTTPSSLMVTWEGDATAFSCQLDGGAAAACASPWPLMGLAGGSHTFVLTAVDGVGNSLTPPPLTWTVNDPPTVGALADATVAEDGQTVVNVTVADGQSPAAALTVTATSDNPSLLPDSALTMGGSGAGRTLTLVPAGNQSGSATVTVIVSDGGLSGPATFVLTVTAVNDPPTLSDMGPQSTAESTPTPALPFTVSDLETAAGSLVVTAASSNTTLLPLSGIALAGSGAGRTVTLTPAAGQNGTATVTLSVSDGTASTGDTFLFSVGAVDDPPTLSDIGNQTTAEDTAVTAAFTLTDPDTALASLVVTGSSSNVALIPDAGATFGGGGGSRTVTVTPAANQSGTSTITVSVTDGISTRQDTFLVTVNPVNDPPTISNVPDQTAGEDTAVGATFSVGDVDTAAGSLTLTGTSSNTTLVPNANVTFGGTGASRTVTVTPAANQSGTATLTVTVSDGNATASDTFVVTVSPVNDPPTLTDIANQTTAEDTALTAPFTVGDVETAAGSLTLAGASSNTTLVPTANITFGGSGASRTVTVTPTSMTGTATVTLTVSDGSATASDAFVLTVNAPSSVTVATAASPAGSGTTVVSTCGAATCAAPPATSVTLTASPATNRAFASWSGPTCPVAGSTSAAASFTTAFNDVGCTANFYALWARDYGGSLFDSLRHVALVNGRPVVAGDTFNAAGQKIAVAIELDANNGTVPFGATVQADLLLNGDRLAPFGATDDYVVLGHPDQASGVFLFQTKLGALPSSGRSLQPVLNAVGVDMVAADGNLFVASMDNVNGTSRARITKLGAGLSPSFDTSICNGRKGADCTGGCCPCDSTYPVAVQPTADGGAYVVSQATQGSLQAARTVVMVTRFATDGKVVWNREYATAAFQPWPTGAAVSANRRELVIVGEAAPNAPGFGNPLWMKLDDAGDLVWSFTANLASTDSRANAVTPLGAGYALVGSVASSTNTDAWMMTVDAAGQIRVSNAYGGTLSDVANSVAAMPGGGLIMVGDTYSVPKVNFNEDAADGFALRLDETGVITMSPAKGMSQRSFAISAVDANLNEPGTCPPTVTTRAASLVDLAITAQQGNPRVVDLLQ